MSIAEDQSADFRAPEVTKILTLSADTTSRAYDLAALDLGTSGAEVSAPPAGASERWVYLTIYATTEVYVSFDRVATRTIDTTAAIAAGNAPAFSVTGCWPVPAGADWSRRIERILHRYLYLRTASGTAKVYVQASSGQPPGASAV